MSHLRSLLPSGCLGHITSFPAHHPQALGPGSILLESLQTCLQACAPPAPPDTPRVPGSESLPLPPPSSTSDTVQLNASTKPGGQVLQYTLNVCANLAAADAGRTQLTQRPAILQVVTRCN